MTGARRAGVRTVFLLVAIALPLSSSHPAAALCPNCLGQARAFTSKQELLGAFLLVPFLTAWLAARLIRRFSRLPPSD